MNYGQLTNIEMSSDWGSTKMMCDLAYSLLDTQKVCQEYPYWKYMCDNLSDIELEKFTDEYVVYIYKSFIDACKSGNLFIVCQYLHVSTPKLIDEGLIWAISRNQVRIIDILNKYKT